MKIYVGMGLTHAPPAFRDVFQKELKDELRKLPGVSLLDFVGIEAGTERDVYQHDKHCTETADLCLFVADYPSIGLGMEIIIREATSKPMIVIAHTDSKVTRMLLGMCEETNTPLVRYKNVQDIIAAIQQRS